MEKYPAVGPRQRMRAIDEERTGVRKENQIEKTKNEQRQMSLTEKQIMEKGERRNQREK